LILSALFRRVVLIPHAFRRGLRAAFALGRRQGPPLRFHDLRHTFLSRLVRHGIAPAHIQKVAGHASITTTERYTHLSGTEAALAVREAVNGAIREVTFRGGDNAAHTGETQKTPGEPGVHSVAGAGLEPATSRL